MNNHVTNIGIGFGASLYLTEGPYIDRDLFGNPSLKFRQGTTHYSYKNQLDEAARICEMSKINISESDDFRKGDTRYMLTHNIMLQNKIEKLERELAELKQEMRIHLFYAPEGEGMREAEKSFEDSCNGVRDTSDSKEITLNLTE